MDGRVESLGGVAPEGALQLWNRSVAGSWGLEPQLLDSHPSAVQLLDSISHNLRTPKQAKAVGDIIRAATLDRKEKAGRIDLADGRTLEFAGIPLPDGNGLLTVLDITDSQKAEKALRERNLALEDAEDRKSTRLNSSH